MVKSDVWWIWWSHVPNIQLKDATAPRGRTKDDAYLPAIAARASSLKSMRGSLSQSCSHLYDQRRGSLSSVASQRTGAHPKKQVTSLRVNMFWNSRRFFQTLPLFSYQSNLKSQKEAKKSNVTVTMTYLGQGRRGSGLRSPRDELRVLQQVNGGENICVFKGSVTPGGRSREKGGFSL